MDIAADGVAMSHHHLFEQVCSHWLIEAARHHRAFLQVQNAQGKTRHTIVGLAI